MKATGIIRRIDELGRIVLPKEIRKNFRIKEGENLEIFIDDNDNIILKKHSLIKNINDLAQNLTDAIYSFLKHNVIISDTDSILAASGQIKKEYINKPISAFLESKLKKREEIFEKDIKNISLIESKELHTAYIINPITVNGDIIGSVIIFDNDINETDYKMSSIASRFISYHLE